MSLNVDAIVLAGGLGTRLRGVLPDGLPKIMANVGGRPFIEFLLARLQEQGVNTVVLALGYGARHVVDYLHSRRAAPGLELRHVIEPAPLGTGGALRHACSQTRSDPLLALNGDTYCNADMKRLLDFHLRRKASVTMALARVDDTSRYGRVECMADGRVTGFAEKDSAPTPGLINCGVYAISRSLVEQLPPDKPASLERDVLGRPDSDAIFGIEAADRFLDIGTPESYAAAPSFLAPMEARQ